MSRYSPLRNFSIDAITNEPVNVNGAKYPHISTTPLINVSLLFSSGTFTNFQEDSKTGLIYVFDNEPNTCLNINLLKKRERKRN